MNDPSPHARNTSKTPLPFLMKPCIWLVGTNKYTILKQMLSNNVT